MTEQFCLLFTEMEGMCPPYFCRHPEGKYYEFLISSLGVQLLS
jgi:hypothetical protein